MAHRVAQVAAARDGNRDDLNRTWMIVGAALRGRPTEAKRGAATECRPYDEIRRDECLPRLQLSHRNTNPVSR